MLALDGAAVVEVLDIFNGDRVARVVVVARAEANGVFEFPFVFAPAVNFLSKIFCLLSQKNFLYFSDPISL